MGKSEKQQRQQVFSNGCHIVAEIPSSASNGHTASSTILDYPRAVPCPFTELLQDKIPLNFQKQTFG